MVAAPPLSLRAEAPAFAALVQELKTRLLWAALIGAAVAGGVLWVEYRLMILTLFALVPAAIVYGDLRRAAHSAGEGFVELRCEDGAVVLSCASGPTRVNTSELVAVRVTPGFLVLAQRAPPPAGFRTWLIPGETAAVRAAGEALASLGAPVSFERGALASVAQILGGVLLWKALGLVAAGMVLGGLANIVLFLAGRDGSLWLGLLLMAGAVAAMVVGALVRRWLLPVPGERR
ncbi:MAG: hypothetical protein ACYC8T_06660 [Myxococcaceae bacterium]